MVSRRKVLAAGPAAAAGLLAGTGASATAAAAGTSMPVGNLKGWKQIFTEDFTTSVPVGQFPGSVYGGKWSGYSGFGDTSGHGWYLPSRVLSVNNSALQYYLHTENGKHLVAAPVPLFNGNWNSQTYGRYSIRLKADPLPNYKLAFLLWPTDNNWTEGEIDYPEGDLGGQFYAASRRAWQGNWVKFDGTGALGTFGSWHICTTEWTPGKVAWYLDGYSVGSTTINTPNSPMRWTLQAETGINEPAPANWVAGSIYVDWVTAYSYAPGT